ncbi:hypothetical protein ABZ714_29565 [Streptomyces sp. NPDC006798]|uniref:hypothetical protein n=1 Tax=Streptomyces sp. NPDC006798 TaxID=3155462 RepID=UPI0033D8E2E7
MYGAKVTLISAVSMRLARPESAAGDYTLPLCVEGVFITAVNAAGLALAARTGFVWPVLLAVVVAAAGLLVPGWLRRNLAQGENGPEPRAVAGTVPCPGRRAGRPVSLLHSHRGRRS